MDKYQILRKEGKLFGTIKRARQLHENRVLARTIKKQPTLPKRFHKSAILIPLGNTIFFNKSIQSIRQSHSKKKNWTECTPGLNTRLQTNYLGRYSSRCHYTHYTYTPVIQSYCRILNGKLFCHIDGKKYIKNPPQGYKWENQNGLSIVSIRNKNIEYHVTASELIQPNWYNIIRQNAILNYKTRQKLIREEKLREKTKKEKEKDWKIRLNDAIKTDCYIRIKDSLLSGNCEAGTRSWATRHGIDSNYVKLKEITNYLIEDRVKLAALTAIKRHKNSLLLGYSEL